MTFHNENCWNLEILGASVIRGGIETGLGTPETIAGDIQLKATGNVLVGGSGSGIDNLVRLNSTGRAGNITVEAGSFNQRDRNRLNSSTYGRGNAGNVNIKADSVALQDRAAIISSSFGVGDAGNVTVTAKDAVLIKGNASIFSNVDAGGVGKGGNIDIIASSLSLQDGSFLASLTNNARGNQPAGKGDAGNINVTVTGAVDVFGTKNGFASFIVSSIAPGATGKGGNITIDSGSLSLRDGAIIQSSTQGVGNAGNVTVKAKDNVSLVGNSNTGIFSTVSAGGVGKGGNIDITAGSLSLQDAQLLTITRSATDTWPAGKGDAGNVTIKTTGAVDIANTSADIASGIASIVDTDSVGNAGNITISAASVNLRNGSQLQSATFGQGNAGTIKINATEFVTFAGKTDNLTSSLFVNSESPTGTAGDIVVTTPKLTLDSGTLDAKSLSGNGGNINIKQADLLLLRRGSQITTNASGTDQAGGNGGNINIDSKLIVAIPKENSDISANAIKGRGGNVTINSQGLFGIQYRPTGSPLTNDITASSTFGQSGIVQINTPGTDPGKNKGELVAAPNDASNQISQACGASQWDNKFYITGRGGLPPNAREPQESDALWEDARAVKDKPATTASLPPKYAPPAIGWVFEKNGRVRLIAAQSAGELTGTRVVCPNAGK